jgi:hypothetical protein
VRLELVPVSQSSGLEVFSDVSPFTGGDAEVVTDADLAVQRIDEAKGLCSCVL